MLVSIIELMKSKQLFANACSFGWKLILHILLNGSVVNIFWRKKH